MEKIEKGICKHCGTEIEVNTKCFNCGTFLKKEVKKTPEQIEAEKKAKEEAKAKKESEKEGKKVDKSKK
jgi:hypothetical protein